MTARTAEVGVGETLQRLREARGISLRSLATQAGFSPSFVSQVENGLTSPSIASLSRLGQCLGVGLSEFFDQAEGELRRVSRTAQRRNLTSGWSRARLEALVPHGALTALDGLLLTIDPGGRSGKHPSVQPAEQLAVVLEGRLHLSIGTEPHVLEAGDAAAIPAGGAHLWENREERPARLILVQAPPDLSEGPPGDAPKTPSGDS